MVNRDLPDADFHWNMMPWRHLLPHVSAACHRWMATRLFPAL